MADGGSPPAEHRRLLAGNLATPTRQDRRHPPALSRNGQVANGVNTTMDAMQLAGDDSTSDRVFTNARRA
jgi:hypothetical protein